MKSKLNKLAGWFFIAINIWVALSGIGIVMATSGSVSGSEFGMLITLADLQGKILLWLAAFGIWQFTKDNTQQV